MEEYGIFEREYDDQESQTGIKNKLYKKQERMKKNIPCKILVDIIELE